MIKIKSISQLSFVALALLASFISFQNCSENFQSENNAVPDQNANLSAPTIILSNDPKPIVNSNSYSFSFNVSGVAQGQIQSIRCILGNGEAQDCSLGTISYSNLADGDYVFSVTATTISNVSAQIVKSFRIDTTPPTIQIVSQPPSASNLSSASFVFQITDNLSVISTQECSVDSNPFSACSSPVVLPNLSSGTHNFKLRATDAAGNLNSTEDINWIVDLSVPVVNLSQKQSSITNLTSALFSFSGPTIVKFECKIDSQPYSACVSPVSYTVIPGIHSFLVRGANAAGTTSLPVAYSWMVDQTAPIAPTLAQNVGSPTNSTTATFTFSATDSSGISGYLCSLDSAAFSSCSSPKTVESLASGTHNFEVKATDLAGNISNVSQFNWSVDLSVQSVIISHSPSSYSNSGNSNFTFSGTGVISFECQLDSQGFSSCTSPKNYTSVSTGVHSFQVRGKNAAGTLSSVTSANWVVDLVAPLDPALSSNVTALTNQTSAGFDFSATDSSGISGYLCSLDSAAFSSCSSPKTVESLASGTHNFEVKATDLAGNISNVSQFNWFVDLSIPSVIISQRPSSISNSGNSNFIFSGTDVISFECQLDSQGFSSCTSPKNYTSVSTGVHSFQVRGKNAAGTLSSVTSANWVVDLTPPTKPVLVQNVNVVTNLTNANFSFSANDASGIASFQCSLDNSKYQTCVSPLSLNSLNSGNHAFGVKAVDLAGNLSATSQFSWLVDTNPPTLPVISSTISGGVTDQNSVLIYFQSTDAESRIKDYSCILDGVATSCVTSPVQISSLSIGLHNFSIMANDNANNHSDQATLTWRRVDAITPPNVFARREPTSLPYDFSNDSQSLGTSIGLPEFNMPFASFQPQTLYTSSITLASSGIYVSSACGVFKSTDNGNTFASLSLPGLDEYPFSSNIIRSAFFVDNNNIYIGTLRGLYASFDGGASYSLILDHEKGQAILNNNRPPCTSVNLGENFLVHTIYAKGSTILLGTGMGLLVSHDSGKNFNIPTAKSNGYYLPPLSDVFNIVQSGTNIFITVLQGSGAAHLYRVVRNLGDECEINPTVPDFGLMVSSDNGDSFVPVGSGSAGPGGYSLAVQANKIYFGSKEGNKLLVSSDGGQNFSESPSSGALYPWQPIAIDNSGSVFTIGFEKYTRPLVKSTDFGQSFSQIKTIQNIPSNFIVATDIKTAGNSVYVATDRGISISNDGGVTFSKQKNYSSSFCGYPWWLKSGTISGAANHTYISQSREIWHSTNAGKSFEISGQFNLSSTELMTSGSSVYLSNPDQNSNFLFSSDSGNSFLEKPSGFKDPVTNLFYNKIPNSVGGFFYVSSDSSNLLNLVNLSGSQHVLSAYSNANRIVAAISDGTFATYEKNSSGQGVLVYKKSMPGIGGYGIQKGRVRSLKGNIYVVSDRLWASYDNGSTFSVVTGSPSWGVEIYESDGKIYLTTIDGYLYISTDNGQSFRPMVAYLE